jgi:hypothetical protein
MEVIGTIAAISDKCVTVCNNDKKQDLDIFGLLQQAYKIAHLQAPTMNDVHQQIFELEEKGTRF